MNPKTGLPENRQPFSNRALKAMIIPLFIEQLLQLVVGIADTMMVSYAGEAVVSGASLDTMLYRLFMLLFTSVATGGSVIISQYIGRKENRNAEKAAAHVFLLGSGIAFVSMAFVYLFGNRILLLLYPDVDYEVMDACRVYLRIVMLSFPACAVYSAGAAFFRSMGKTRVTMTVSIFMNLINVVGNAVGIFVLHAGVKGVAWPTVVSWVAAAMVMTARCCFGNNELALRGQDLLRVNRSMNEGILRVAVPNAAENTLFQGAKILLGSFVAGFGTSQIAANGIAQTLWSLGACIYLAVCPIYITVVGQSMGAGDVEAASWYTRKLTRLTVFLAFAWNLISTLAVPLILPFYAVTDETRRLIWIVVLIHNGLSAFLEPFTMPLASGLRAAGDVRFILWSSVFCTVFFRTVMAWLIGVRLGLGIIGVTWAMVMDWGLKAVLDILRFRSGRWTRHRLI